MSTITDAVLQALSDTPQTRQEIAEATGLELGPISTALNTLKERGEAVREDGGWVLGAGAAPARVHQAVDAEAPPPRAKKKAAAAKRVPRAAPAPAADAVAFARFGEYVVVKRADLVDLLAVLERWRNLMDAV